MQELLHGHLEPERDMLGDKGSGLLLEGKSYIVQVNIYEIDWNFFRLSHKMTCYCPAVVHHQSTQIYQACSTSTEKTM